MTTRERIAKGMTKQKIENYRDTFHRWPARFTQEITNQGEGFLQFAVVQPLSCGCTVTGNGSIPFPLTVKPCDKHKP